MIKPICSWLLLSALAETLHLFNTLQPQSGKTSSIVHLITPSRHNCFLDWGPLLPPKWQECSNAAVSAKTHSFTTGRAWACPRVHDLRARHVLPGHGHVLLHNPRGHVLLRNHHGHVLHHNPRGLPVRHRARLHSHVPHLPVRRSRVLHRGLRVHPAHPPSSTHPGSHMCLTLRPKASRWPQPIPPPSQRTGEPAPGARWARRS
mmetsp:Transcript_30706/g.91944  ORF Transcript_30706/g.91944 Transcript_30706/m.91944 type:complete len:204 (-) Transcript_30706:3085-3696(-)